ncbi:flagellar basal body-associated FliL family protein [Planococcus sp. NCCP-2050]|uniref:flagellar basal body-associated FliL family protein n=1 Tax=Planococcus sp. NCCP-2050 TaxID=2944679 RepID=UPI00203CDAA9|nr:flagellar basal body-associated FliL family protein [Planococcus sp. NCCP-2050]GKW46566.1 flagellar protein FliL [Planococcus sp. NCCP-2050]
MGKMKVLVILLIAVVVLGGGAMYYLKSTTAEAETEKKLSAEELVEMSIDTDIITTNLATGENYAVVQFNIQLNSKKAKEATEKRTAEVRAAIISTVAGFTKEELVGKEGIAMLETELKTKLSETITEGKVERVLVTEFKLQ